MHISLLATQGGANSLRRALLESVPCLASDFVTIEYNSSCVPNELLAHRVGQCPVLGRQYLQPLHDWTDKRDNSTCAVFELDVKGRDVLFRDFVCEAHPEIKFVHPEMLLVPLREDQRLRMRAEVVLGRGRDHARWSSVVAPRFWPDKEPAPGAIPLACAQQRFTLSYSTTGAVSRTEAILSAVDSLRERACKMMQQVPLH